ncbi:hypothetical protein CRENBAI_023118, partial [Crenichthys baileyi]
SWDDGVPEHCSRNTVSDGGASDNGIPGDWDDDTRTAHWVSTLPESSVVTASGGSVAGGSELTGGNGASVQKEGIMFASEDHGLVGVDQGSEELHSECQNSDWVSGSVNRSLCQSEISDPTEVARGSHVSGPESVVTTVPAEVPSAVPEEGIRMRLGRFIKPVNRLIQTMATQKVKILS